MPTEVTLSDILTELRTISTLLRNQQPTVSLPPRAPSERDDIFANRISTSSKLYGEPISPPSVEFGNPDDDPISQPIAPELPVATVRVKWTTAMESIIHDCVTSLPGSYRNSTKYLRDKLPSDVPMAAIRNKCSRLGYSIKSNHLYIKEL